MRLRPLYSDGLRYQGAPYARALGARVSSEVFAACGIVATRPWFGSGRIDTARVQFRYATASPCVADMRWKLGVMFGAPPFRCFGWTLCGRFGPATHFIRQIFANFRDVLAAGQCGDRRGLRQGTLAGIRLVTARNSLSGRWRDDSCGDSCGEKAVATTSIHADLNGDPIGSILTLSDLDGAVYQAPWGCYAKIGLPVLVLVGRIGVLLLWCLVC